MTAGRLLVRTSACMTLSAPPDTGDDAMLADEDLHRHAVENIRHAAQMSGLSSLSPDYVD
jgi:hypothetical protein